MPCQFSMPSWTIRPRTPSYQWNDLRYPKKYRQFNQYYADTPWKSPYFDETSMYEDDCPRRFVPPHKWTEPDDIFEPAVDCGARHDRFLHIYDRGTMLAYVDGACLFNGFPKYRTAGCGVVFNDYIEGRLAFPLEGKVGGPEQTNNRAELRAAIACLEMRNWELGGIERLVIATDSEYVVNGACLRLEKWKRYRWIKWDGNPVANKDLWERLDAELFAAESNGFKVLFWRIPRALNGEADAAAKFAAEAPRRPSIPMTLRARWV